jgi:hypothetical protein
MIDLVLFVIALISALAGIFAAFLAVVGLVR